MKNLLKVENGQDFHITIWSTSFNPSRFHQVKTIRLGILSYYKNVCLYETNESPLKFSSETNSKLEFILHRNKEIVY